MDKFIVKRARIDDKTSTAISRTAVASASSTTTSTAVTAFTASDDIPVEAEAMEPEPTLSERGPLETESTLPTSVAILSSPLVGLHAADLRMPCQPLDITYPTQFTGKLTTSGKPKVREFNKDWYTKYPWLHWSHSRGRIFCFSCLKVKTIGLFMATNQLEQSTFVDGGFNDWKNAICAFERHAKSSSHREALAALATQSVPSVDVLLTAQRERDRANASKALTGIITSLVYLARQGLAIRGHDEGSGNFKQLLALRGTDVTVLSDFLRRPKSFTSHEIQNEILQLLGHECLRKIVADIAKSRYFSLIADETTDQSHKEQLSICLRYVDSNLEPVEEFIGLYDTADTTGETLSNILLDVLMRLGLPIGNIRGQCYDGAANMSGVIKGVKTRIQASQPKALYVHCFAHSLNLSVQDSVRSVPLIRDALQCLHDLSVITRGSAKRVQAFADISAGVELWSSAIPKPLCPTRWCVRFIAIDAALRSYCVIVPYLSEVTSMSTADDSAAKARGLLTQFENGLMYLTLSLMHAVFGSVEALSRVLQARDRTVTGAMEAVNLTVNQLKNMRTEAYYEKIFSHVEDKIAEYELHKITLPRHVRPPRRYDEKAHTSDAHVFERPADFYRVQYFNFLDVIINNINSRFDQPGMKMYSLMESVVTAACKKQTFAAEVEELCNTYDEFNKSRLIMQLAMLPDLCPAATSVPDAIEQFKSKSLEVRGLFDEVQRLMELLLVVPASSATAERSFSALRRLKTYLRATMAQERLNHVTLLHVHQNRVDCLDIKSIQTAFVSANDYRRSVFND